MPQNSQPRTPDDDIDHSRYRDHSVDLVARIRAAREAAEREMNKFGNVSEYEVRKIYGQRSELIYDEDVPVARERQTPVAANHERKSAQSSGDDGASEIDSRQSRLDFEASTTPQVSPGKES